MTGIVFDIQRFSIHDGPGIRTTVFLKGCPMRCAWCHNPESFELRPQLGFSAGKCTRCGACAAVCPQKVHRLSGGEHVLERSACTACGACVENCVYEALRIYGKVMTTDAVMREVQKDDRYYASSGGGVTFSGGEATMQYAFLLQLLQACRNQGVHTALETNGYISQEKLGALCQVADLILLDYKVTDEKAHRTWTGVSNRMILDNLDYLCRNHANIVLRCPIISGVNDDDAHFDAIRRLQMQYGKRLCVEIMPYHNTGAQKWSELGLNYALKEIPSATEQQKQQWTRQARVDYDYDEMRESYGKGKSLSGND